MAHWARIHAACFVTPRPWSEDELTGMLQNPHVFALGDSHGFLLGRAIAGESELLTLAVSPDARRKGIGRALVQGFLEHAQTKAAETAFLEVAASNVAAISLYMQAGFVKAGLRRAYYNAPDGTKIDALILTRVL